MKNTNEKLMFAGAFLSLIGVNMMIAAFQKREEEFDEILSGALVTGIAIGSAEQKKLSDEEPEEKPEGKE